MNRDALYYKVKLHSKKLLEDEIYNSLYGFFPDLIPYVAIATHIQLSLHGNEDLYTCMYKQPDYGPNIAPDRIPFMGLHV